MRKCTRVYTLCSFITSLHVTHKHYSAYWLASLHEHISVYMQTHELCLLMLTGMCLTSSSLPVYYAPSVVHAHQLWCNGKTGHAQGYNNAVCLHFKSQPQARTHNYLYNIFYLCSYMQPYWSMLIKMNVYIHALHIQSAPCTLITYIM